MRALGRRSRDDPGGVSDVATTGILITAGYLLGSVPFGLWLVRWRTGDDIRRHGSGNIGATNVWRAYGRSYGIPVILFDVAKGFVPALLGAWLVNDLAGVLAGGAAMAGHWRPLYLGFARGGKTVATTGGTFLGVAPVVGVLAAVLWLAVFGIFRYASLASIVTACALPVMAALLGEPWPVVAFGAAAAVAVLLLHRANIGRLRRGTENRFDFGRRRSTPA
jgi:glycerol-3-phosphate acyltransferase PlsY